ncbi:hypothetical protein EV174_004633 [Coemansia sp. RSA 2320]|nr:hypothetical protein EV174_004633 [Coemansia sp. RSA 2320]
MRDLVGAGSEAAAATLILNGAIDGRRVPQWMAATRGVAELLGGSGSGSSSQLTWAAGADALACMLRTAPAAAVACVRAEIPAAQDAARAGRGVDALGARIGGLLRARAASSDSGGALAASPRAKAEIDAAEAEIVEAEWAARLRQSGRWAEVAAMASGLWAEVRGGEDQGADQEDQSPCVAPAVAAALAAFWPATAAAANVLALGRLLELGDPGATSTTAAATAQARYRGFVVKKKRRAAAASAAAAADEASLTASLTASGVEALAEARVLVGSHGQDDGAAGGLLVRRWRQAEAEKAEEGGGEDSCEEEEEEDALRRVCVAASPVALRWWAPLHMRPVGGAKRVRYALLLAPRTPAAGVYGFLADVDSAFRAAHLGTHRALEAPPVPETETDDDASWAAGLRRSAARAGRCLARAATADPRAALVLYVGVPRASSRALWLAMADAACAARAALAVALAPRAPPPLGVHALALDALAAQHGGRRAPSACALATAMAVYNGAAPAPAAFARRAAILAAPCALPDAAAAAAADPDRVHVRFHLPASDAPSLYARLVAHPLAPAAAAAATLHCVYAVARGWVAVCWCDERAEFLEHDVFPDEASEGGALSPAAVARVWRGCLRFHRAVAATARLRVVLAQWRGMSAAHAAAWRAAAQPHAPHVALYLASVGCCPPLGLRLSGSPSGPSLFLHGHQPLLRFFAAPHDDEPFAAPSPPHAATGYLVAAPQLAPAAALPCLCLQLLEQYLQLASLPARHPAAAPPPPTHMPLHIAVVDGLHRALSQLINI